MLKQKEVLERVNIKARLLRFWIKEYNLENYYISKKTGNRYKRSIIPILRLVNFLKKQDIFTTNAIKKIVDNVKSGNITPQNMPFFKETSKQIIDLFTEENNLKEEENIKEVENNKEEYYFDLLKKSENLISKNNFFDAINLLTLVKNNSNTYNLIASEMIEIARSYDKGE